MDPSDKVKFRKHTNAPNINWEDRKVTPAGLKQYRQTCLRCGADRGYQQSCDWKRTCWKCKVELAKKYTDAHRRLRASMKASISIRLRHRKSGKAGNHTFKLVGYTLEQLVAHLEAHFQPGMTWDNYGQWHVDHKRPDSSFDYDSVNHPEFKECWSLSNLQPLWAHDNFVKSAKWST